MVGPCSPRSCFESYTPGSALNTIILRDRAHVLPPNCPCILKLDKISLPWNSANMEHASSSFQISPSQEKLRDGRYGPVFHAIRDDTGEFLTAELLEEPGDPDALRSLLSDLDKRQVSQAHPYVVSYLGHQQKEDKIYILTEHLAGGTLRQLIRKNGALPQPLARSLLRQVVLGLHQLQKQGRALALLDSRNILLGHDGAAKIEAPLLDVTVSGQSFPPAFLSLPGSHTRPTQYAEG